MPQNLFDEALKLLDHCLKSLGVNPNYFATLAIVPLSILFLWGHRNEIKNWEELNYLNKINFVTAFVLVIAGTLLFVFTLLGIAKD